MHYIFYIYPLYTYIHTYIYTYTLYTGTLYIHYIQYMLDIAYYYSHLMTIFVLQLQTGIMLLDNISTVLRTLAAIKEQKQQEEEYENNGQLIKNSLTIQDNHHTTTTTTTTQYKQASSVIVRHSSIPSNTSTTTTTAGFDELVGAGSKIDFSGEGEHPTATTGTTTLHRASTTSSITSMDIGKTTAPSGKWEWNGHDYVWITTKPAAELLQEKGLGQVELEQQRHQEEDCLLEKREIAMKKIDSRLDLEQSVVSEDTVPIDLFQEASSLPSASIGANTTSRVPVVLSTPLCSQTPVTSPKPCSQTPVASPKPCSQTPVSSPKPSSPRWPKPVMPSPSMHSVAATTYTDDADFSAPVITATTSAPLVSSIKTTKPLSTEPITTTTAATTTDTYTTSTSLSYSCTLSKKQRTSPSKQAKTADLFPVCSSRAPLRAASMRAPSLLSSTTQPPSPTAGPSHADTTVLHSSHRSSSTAATGSISRRDSAQLTATTSTTTKNKNNTSAMATTTSLQTNTTKSTKQCIQNKTTTNNSSNIVSSNISTEQKSGWRSKRKFASSV